MVVLTMNSHQMSMFEIYNETLRDLLVPNDKSGPKLEVRATSQGMQVQGLTSRDVSPSLTVAAYDVLIIFLLSAALIVGE